MMVVNKIPGNTSQPHISLYFEVDDGPDHRYGGMIAFHGYVIEGGLEIHVHKNGAYDEEIGHFQIAFPPEGKWCSLLLGVKVECQQYVNDLP